MNKFQKSSRVFCRFAAACVVFAIAAFGSSNRADAQIVVGVQPTAVIPVAPFGYTSLRPVIAARPALGVYAPVVARPVVVSRPVLAAGSPYVAYGAMRPVVVASPAVPTVGTALAIPAAVPPAAVSVARPVVAAPAVVAPVAVAPAVVRTKVYIPGQPVRNVLRAVTP
ncbi:MAG: hypothetical protein AAF664_05585 [Planctomycetota bacterium]